MTAATNDAGLITLPDGKKLAVAVFITDSPESEVVRDAVIAQIAKEIWTAANRSEAQPLTRPAAAASKLFARPGTAYPRPRASS